MGTRDELNSTNSSSGQPEEHFSIIRNREDIYQSKQPPGMGGGVGGGPPGMPSYGYSSDDGYGIASDSEIFINERYKNDDKLRKRCAVVITPTKELIQYERKRDQMYNEILQKQRRKLELRALEKQREKERRRMGSNEEFNSTESLVERDKDKVIRRRGRSQPDIIMSSESEIETNFQVRTRKQRLQSIKDLQQPLNIQIGMNDVTNCLLSQIDAHLDKPVTKKPTSNGNLKTGKLLKDKRYQKEEEDEENVNEKKTQQSCDITDKSLQQQTKLKDLNILNDIAQHLSPYQLDLPENSNSNSNNTIISNTTAKTTTSMLNKIENRRTTVKEKINVTEHLILQTFDNLLEKNQTQLDNNKHPDQQAPLNDEQQECQQEQHQEQPQNQQQISGQYNQEPKLNIAAILNSTSPLETQDHTTTTNENSEEDHNNTEQILKANMPSDEALEQILEESISVLKSVTSPFNECTETPETTNTTTIPLLISNVESLNHLETNQTKDNENLTQIVNREKEIQEDITQNITKDNLQPEGTPQQQLSSTLINPTECTIICSTYLTHLSVDTEIRNSLKVTPLMPADLSDISLESEMSKHLPDIAEPSPVVTTDMSDNSNASDASRAFSLEQNTHITRNNTNVETLTTVLPLVMPSLTNANNEDNLETPPEPPVTNVIEQSFIQANSCLNTPIKLNTLNREPPNCNDLNTPLKFPLPPADLVEEKNNLEPEADSNVTKFLDLILNKTVSDAESETRDKIIKELNALTAEATANSTELAEEEEGNMGKELVDTKANEREEKEITADTTGCNLEAQEESLTPLDTAVNEQEDTNKTKTLENEEAIETDVVISKEAGKETENLTLEETKENANSSQKPELNSPKQTEEQKTPEGTKQTQEEISNLSQDKEGEKKSANENKKNKDDNLENTTQTLQQATTEETTNTNTNFTISPGKLKIKHLKKKLNIKCRVRLKRLHIDEQIKTSIAINPNTENPTKPNQDMETPAINNSKDTNCDITMMDSSSTMTTNSNMIMKKPCLKLSQKRLVEDVMEAQQTESNKSSMSQETVIASKKLKLDVLENCAIKTNNTPTPPTNIAELNYNELLMNNCCNNLATTPSSSCSSSSSSTAAAKTKSKVMKTVTFDLSNLNENLRNTPTFTREKKQQRSHAASIAGGAMGCYLKATRTPRKLPDNTLRAAETLQIFVNTLNDSNRTPPSAEFNKKRSPIKNKCIAEDETPRPPPAATLMGTQPCKKVCSDKTRSQISTSSSSASSSKCKDQLVSSLATPPTISNITSDITTARIYTSSPLDQTLPEYDDNVVDTVADTELILPTTTGSLRRKLKRPKKSLQRPLPVDDINTDDISNQPECNGEDDTDAVVDNEDDVFVEELLPIPAANEHILEEIVSARPTHMGPGSIRDDYMNIEATATVPVYLFNDESRDLATPEPIQSSDTTNVVDSSSYLNTSSTTAINNTLATASNATTTSQHLGNLEKSMLSPSEHEVSSTQETFYQTPTKSKQSETFGEKSSSNNKEKANNNSSISFSASQKLKNDENNFQHKEEMETSSTTGLLQNNQVDTTNHSPEMCTLTLTPPTNTMTTSSSSSSNSTCSNNRKIRKVSTHDEILYNELQQQQQQQTSSKRKNLNNSNATTTSCAESTSGDNTNPAIKMKLSANSLDDNINNKTNGSLAKVEDKFKKLLKEVCKRDKNSNANELNVTAENNLGPGNATGSVTTLDGGSSGGGGGSSPSTTTIINEEKLYRSKRKKQKSSKSSKCKNHPERTSSKIVLKASKLAAHIPANPLIITIPKSRLLRPPPTPTPPSQLESQNELLQQQQDNEFLDIPNAKLFIEKDKTTTTMSSTIMAMSTSSSALKSHSQSLMQQQHHSKLTHQHYSTNKPEQTAHAGPAGKTKRNLSPANTTTTTEMQVNKKTNHNTEPTSINNKKQELQQQQQQHTINANSTINTNKEKSSLSLTKKKSKNSSSTNSNATKASSSSSSSSANTSNSSANNNKSNNCSSSTNSSSINTKSNSNNNNTNLVFVKDKYDLIKSKDKHQHNNQNSSSGVGGSLTNTEVMEHKLKDNKNGGQSSTSSSTSSTTRSHKSLSSKDKSKNSEKIKDKHKEKDIAGKSNSSEINNKNLTNSTTSSHNNKTSNKTKSSSSSSSTSSTTNAVLKSKSSNTTQNSNSTAANNTPQPLSNSFNNVSTNASSGSSNSSSSASVTISNNHVRKKLKTK